MTAFTDLDLGSAPNIGDGTTLRAGAAIINANNALAANLTEDNVLSGNNTFNVFFGIGVPSLLTIASAAVTAVRSYHKVDGEGGVDDTLDTINGGVDGNMLILGRGTLGIITVVNTGNISLASSPRLLSVGRAKLMLIYDATATKWVEISYSANP